MKKLIYRAEDVVRIVNPLFVTRVGYPWDKEYVKKNVITDDQRKALTEMLEKFHLRPSYFGFEGKGYFDNAFEKILDEMAYWVMKTQGFGGRERTIHTELREDCRGKLAKIISKRVVKTGEYFPSTSYYDYNGETEYEPGGLRKEKTHVLLNLDIFSDDGMWAMISSTDKMEIEECHVEIYKQQKEWEVSLWPNNQPPILLGVYRADTKEEAKNRACVENGIQLDDDNLSVEENGKDTPMKRWKSH